jgi:hypothetical protein
MLRVRPGNAGLADLIPRERELMLLVLGGTLHVHNLMTRPPIDSVKPRTTSSQHEPRGLRRLAWWSATSHPATEPALARRGQNRLPTDVSVPVPPSDEHCT